MRQFVPADFKKISENLHRLQEHYFTAGCREERAAAEAAIAAAMRWIETALSSFDQPPGPQN
ncbi:hypothetical protein [Leisingera sp. ANG-Vp]|uniref:hypothetical protein n=1 Tax=Leisingera sp. ANG-Vp TaxID=1577896 RepID=UPI00057F9054|nr:hypothetical protein [Leisingera sp. ANG-Vp]KIC20190.1 hypothetical protein RA20_09985 [Leisingera sp. ANG-Vp]